MENPSTKGILLVLSLILVVASVLLGVSIWQSYKSDVSNVVEAVIDPQESEEFTEVEEKPQEEIKGEADVQNLIEVKKVVDGDTIIIAGDATVRYTGIDTPETVDPRRPVGCYGKEASHINKQLVNGKMVRLEKDISETDKYGRLLRYIFVSTENGELFVNDYLVRQGYAKSNSYPPDIKYQQQFVEAQQEAMANNRGLWGACK